ncbi:hypothetical protein, partial [Okeania sp. SIO2G5]|uniref:hypothetical protein n=1 Tax=Okeania sp. SIO2G5 TaxID=2607796 RepID=UPI00257DADEF
PTEQDLINIRHQTIGGNSGTLGFLNIHKNSRRSTNKQQVSRVDIGVHTAWSAAPTTIYKLKETLCVPQIVLIMDCVDSFQS